MFNPLLIVTRSIGKTSVLQVTRGRGSSGGRFWSQLLQVMKLRNSATGCGRSGAGLQHGGKVWGGKGNTKLRSIGIERCTPKFLKKLGNPAFSKISWHPMFHWMPRLSCWSFQKCHLPGVFRLFPYFIFILRASVPAVFIPICNRLVANWYEDSRD